MSLNLLFWSLMMTTAMTTSPTPSPPIAQTQNQSVSSTTPSEAVRVAAKNATFWFRSYVIWAVLAVLVSVILTWMVWRSGNLLQDAAVADVSEAAGQANKAAGEANERAAKLEKEAQELKRSNLEMEKALAPRVFRATSVNGRSNWESLKPFAGIQAIVRFDANAVPKGETERAASDIKNILELAGWKIIAFEPTTSFPKPFAGVFIETYMARWPANNSDLTESEKKTRNVPGMQRAH